MDDAERRAGLLARAREMLKGMLKDDPDGPESDRARSLLGRIAKGSGRGDELGQPDPSPAGLRQNDFVINERAGLSGRAQDPRDYGAEVEPGPVDPKNPTAQEIERGQNPHDWLTTNIASGLPAKGLGRLLGAAGEAIAPNAQRATKAIGRLVQGGTEGGAATFMGGGDVGDVALGVGLGALAGGRPKTERHAPRTQAEIDAAVIKEARATPSPAAAMEGRHEPFRLAQEADATLDRAVDARTAVAKGKLDTADHSFAMVDGEAPVPNTAGAIRELEAIRERTHGGQGAQYRTSDKALEELQSQLTFGEEGVPALPRDRLRRVHVAANQKAEWEAKNGGGVPEGEVRAGAGVLSRLVRASDPRRGPVEPNIGISLDEYAREMDDLTKVNKLRGPEAGRVAKLADVGAVNQDSSPSAMLSEAQIRQLEAAESSANPLIRAIRANNTLGRRGIQAPNLGYSPTMTLGRGLLNNASNLMFKLAPPNIDAAGMVAGRHGAPNLSSGMNAAGLNTILERYLEAQQRDKDRAAALKQDQ